MKRAVISRNETGRESSRRRGVVVVFTAVMAMLLLGLAALTVDVGVMYNTRADLQRAADAGALAAASVISGLKEGDPTTLAIEAATEAVRLNRVLGREVTIDDSDVIVARANYDPDANGFNFAASTVLSDAVWVRVRMTEGSPNGPAPLYFAKVFGRSSKDISAEAIAYLGPRDVAITVDTSGSTNDDSELRHFDLTPINLRDVWAALPNNAATGIDEESILSEPEMGGASDELEGPAWGYLRELGWGSELDPDLYDPVEDDGLVRLAYDRNWNDAKLSQYLADQGYSADEIAAINSDQYDTNGAYDERVAVALGLAYWNSGMPGGLWEERGVPAAQTGNRNGQIATSELEWRERVFDRTANESAAIWRDYIDGYVRRSNTAMAGADAGFQYSYGIKTFVNYLLERRGSYAGTPELAETPAQPIQAIKDAVGYMVGLLDGLQTSDQMSLVIYASTAHLEVPLTGEFDLIRNRMMAMQAGHYDSLTNMGGGLRAAIEELSTDRARAMSRKVIVMLTDGQANVDADGRYSESSNGGAEHALAMAREAAAEGIQIHTISVGAAADQDLMKKMAEVGNGKHFHAEGTIENYSVGLADIFRTIGMSRTVELIQ